MKWFLNMKIGAKLILGFILVAIIAGVIGVVGILNIKSIDNADKIMYERISKPLGELVIITESYQRMRGNVKDIVLAETSAEVADYASRIEERNQEFDTNLTSFETTLLTAEGKKVVAELRDLKMQYDALAMQMIDYVNNGDKDSAHEIMNGEANDIRLLMDEKIDYLKNTKVSLAEETSISNGRLASTATVTMIVLLVIGILLSIILGIVISNLIKKPINQILLSANEIAAGNLDVNININTKEETGQLAAAFKAMTDNINDVISNINSASEQVAAGSNQLSESSMSLSQGATEQASSIEELTASIEQIAAQTKQNALNAEKAKEMATSAQKYADQGNCQMAEMLKAMTEINNSSNNISKIIKVIDDIAFQTNILALNAAVEAARAGQHGKGFAVVAEEVRNLAAKSANAAKETTTMIEGSIQKVEGGTKIANETAIALKKIVEGVSQATDLVSQIATASSEQAIGVDQVNQGIMQISDVVQTTSATAQETAAASEELSGQAEVLKSQVATFKLKKAKGSKGQYDSLDPEILRMLENMNSANQDNHKMIPSKRILLSDTEFEKY